jgi:acetate kinase
MAQILSIAGDGRRIMAINRGSSTLKVALFESRSGRLDRVQDVTAEISSTDSTGWKDLVVSMLGAHGVDVCVHRIVFGGPHHWRPEELTEAVLFDLQALAYRDPLHMPPALDIVEHLLWDKRTPFHVACYDTGFHHSMPSVAKRYALPDDIVDQDVTRYGYHGLSCENAIAQLSELDPAAARGRVVIAHLGSGSSLTAVRNGASLDTTMGLSVAGGLVMSTRSGDLDPGVLVHLVEAGYAAGDLRELFNSRSGLRGISGTSGDMKSLLAAEATDTRAQAAVEVFCYHCRKHLAAMAAVLEGLDAVVFTGGIGENAAIIRERICRPLSFLGLLLDDEGNKSDAGKISAAASAVGVFVIAADEQRVMAGHGADVLSSRSDIQPSEVNLS